MTPPTLTNDEKLKRLIYVCNMEPKYICGDPGKYIPVSKPSSDLINDYLKNSPLDFLNIIVSASEDKLLPHRSQLFNILALALVSEEATEKIKPEIRDTVLKICKTDQDFFDFVKYVSRGKTDKCKLPSTMKKTVVKFYKNKSAFDLAKSFALSKSYKSWSHKDLIKLAHVKGDTLLKHEVIMYILFEKFDETNDDAESKKIQKFICNSKKLKNMKDDKIAVPLISELQATMNQVGPQLKQFAEVWRAALRNMSLSEVLQAMPKLHRRGFLKQDSVLKLIGEILTSSEILKASGIHPIEVFIHMRNFIKGGKPLDPHYLEYLVKEKNLTDEELMKLKTSNEPKCPVAVNYLQKCMNISCNNVQPFGKRYLITIDTRKNMDVPCMYSKNITGLEAAAAFAWYLLKVEKDVTIAVFREKEVRVVELDRDAQVSDLIRILKENRSAYVLLAAPIEWAISQQKHVDVFLNFIHRHQYYKSVPKQVKDKMTTPADALQKYKRKMNLQNAKLVNFCMSSPQMMVADGSPDILDVAGLDFGVPKAVEAFCRGHFC